MPRYELHSSGSRFTVQAFASGMLWAFAHNPTIAIKEFTGSLTFSRQTPEKPVLEILVNAHSMESCDAMRPKDKAEIQDTMMQILDVSAYPTVQYKAMEAIATRSRKTGFACSSMGTCHCTASPGRRRSTPSSPSWTLERSGSMDRSSFFSPTSRFTVPPQLPASSPPKMRSNSRSIFLATRSWRRAPYEPPPDSHRVHR